MTDQPHLDVVFDGPPTHDGSRLLDCEDNAGSSVKAGSWIDRGDGTWALRLTHEDIRRPGEHNAVRRPGEAPAEVEERFRAGHPHCEFVTVSSFGELKEVQCITPENHR